LNRHYYDRFDLAEVGSTFTPAGGGGQESRHLGLVKAAPGRKAAQEDAALLTLKSHVQTWAMQVVESAVEFAAPPSTQRDPWQHDVKTSTIIVGGRPVGYATVVPLACRRAMDEHLTAWSIALAEINLSQVVDVKGAVRPLPVVPTHPQTELDFSVVSDAGRRYADLAADLSGFSHPLLRRLSFVDSYEGGSVPAGKRSFTYRARVGYPDRTLGETDLYDFRQSFLAFLGRCGLEIRG